MSYTINPFTRKLDYYKYTSNPSGDALLLEEGDYFLQEDGFFLLLDVPRNPGILMYVTEVSDTYTALLTDEIIVCDKATGFTVTLPEGVIGQQFVIKNIGAGDVTVDGYGSETIDGETTQTVQQWEAIVVQCYALGCWVIL